MPPRPFPLGGWAAWHTEPIPRIWAFLPRQNPKTGFCDEDSGTPGTREPSSGAYPGTERRQGCFRRDTPGNSSAFGRRLTESTGILRANRLVGVINSRFALQRQMRTPRSFVIQASDLKAEERILACLEINLSK